MTLITDDIAWKRVVLIDDDPREIEYVTYFLGKANCSVMLARDCLEGIRLALEHRPSLIICDIKMARIDGFDCARLIRSHASLRPVPLVAFTGQCVPGDMEKALAAGFDDYLEKPMNPWQLIDMFMGFMR